VKKIIFNFTLEYRNAEYFSISKTKQKIQTEIAISAI